MKRLDQAVKFLGLFSLVLATSASANDSAPANMRLMDLEDNTVIEINQRPTIPAGKSFIYLEDKSFGSERDAMPIESIVIYMKESSPKVRAFTGFRTVTVGRGDAWPHDPRQGAKDRITFHSSDEKIAEIEVILKPNQSLSQVTVKHLTDFLGAGSDVHLDSSQIGTLILKRNRGISASAQMATDVLNKELPRGDIRASDLPVSSSESAI